MLTGPCMYLNVPDIFPAAEHWNYFGMDETLGPVAVSLRREKLEEDKEHGQQYNYRLIFRTSEVRHAFLSSNPCRCGVDVHTVMQSSLILGLGETRYFSSYHVYL